MARVLYVSDLHCPANHKKALDHCRRVYEKFKCDRVVFLGDEIDAAAWSTKHPHNPDLPNANDELANAVVALRPWYRSFPDAEVLASNHGSRIFKKFRVCGIPSKVVKRYEEILEYPKGWHFVDQTEIDGVLAIHGDGFSRSSSRIAHEKFKQSVVMGHTHGCGITFSWGRKKKLFSATFGCLIEPGHPAFDYAKHLPERPVLGCGVVISGDEPYFIPLI